MVFVNLEKFFAKSISGKFFEVFRRNFHEYERSE